MATIGKLHKNRILDLGDCEIENTQAFTPHLVNREYIPQIFSGLPDSVRAIAREMVADGWKFYAVDQHRGRCYYRAKTITIPVWAIKIDAHKRGYKCWYICHEMAHAFCISDSHGPMFMARLQETCPPEYVHYEIGYKPRNAIAAGIRKPLDLD